jgi:hypothetical protein
MAARKRTVNMMLARTYVPNWELFEGVREFYANAVDTGDFRVRFPDDDTMVIATMDNPTLDQMFVLGEGNKTSGGDTIGQFGEGSKLAALCLARRRNTKLTIVSPMGEITFGFKKAAGFETSTLHAEINPNKARDAGHAVKIEAKGIAQVYADNFLSPDAPIGPFEKKANAKGMRVFVKGIFITRVPEFSLFDWNIETCTLNRDRSVPDAWSLRRNIGRLIAKQIETDPGLADKLLDKPESYEAKAVDSAWPNREQKEALASAARRKFGDNMVLAASDMSVNALASYKGFSPVALPDHIASNLVDVMDKATDMVSKVDRLEQSTFTPSDGDLRELHRLADILGIPCEIFVCVDNNKHLGAAAWNDRGMARVWLSEKLFVPGARFERIRTMLHELGHLKDKGDDGTVEFEASLDWIAAKLAEFILN